MNNPKTLATLGTHGTGRRQANTYQINKTWSKTNRTSFSMWMTTSIGFWNCSDSEVYKLRGNSSLSLICKFVFIHVD